MSFFDQIADGISRFTKDIGSKAQDLTDTAKLNAKINEASATIRNTYTAIGEAYYKVHKDDEDSELEEQFTIIRDAMATINECRQQIQKIKGIRICPNCGAEVAGTAVFCQACGTRIPAEEKAAGETEEIPEEEEEAAEAAEETAEEESAAEDVPEEAEEDVYPDEDAEYPEEDEEAVPEDGSEGL